MNRNVKLSHEDVQAIMMDNASAEAIMARRIIKASRRGRNSAARSKHLDHMRQKLLRGLEKVHLHAVGKM